jgi:hypothetical protein
MLDPAPLRSLGWCRAGSWVLSAPVGRVKDSHLAEDKAAVDSLVSDDSHQASAPVRNFAGLHSHAGP